MKRLMLLVFAWLVLLVAPACAGQFSDINGAAVTYNAPSWVTGRSEFNKYEGKGIYSIHYPDSDAMLYVNRKGIVWRVYTYHAEMHENVVPAMAPVDKQAIPERRNYWWLLKLMGGLAVLGAAYHTYNRRKANAPNPSPEHVQAFREILKVRASIDKLRRLGYEVPQDIDELLSLIRKVEVEENMKKAPESKEYDTIVNLDGVHEPIEEEAQ